ncbi:MAG: hypothetical protein DMD59_05730 [Gemmatimonadetes bacterium]|nr:MAG: hypothetical protein DMD59_05730 [Gemmatimonadota bacterium]
MDKRLLLTLALLAAACRDAVSPPPHGLGAPAFAVTAASGITLDQQNGTFNDVMPWSNGGSHVGKGFNPQNPHVGDAIVATFFWVGSTNTITTVTDHLSDVAQTPVGNTYTLVDYVTSAGISMATYVATNVRGFPDASTATDSILAVHAIFSTPIPDGGVLLSAWSGVSLVDAEALGTHHSASGSGAAQTIADPGAIPVNAGALAFGVTMSDRLVGLGTPPGFTTVNEAEDPQMKGDAEYVVQGNAAGVADPQWTWFFDQASSPGTWLATAVTLNPATTHLVFTVQPRTTPPLITIAPAVQATVEDDQGNPLTDFTGSVSITIGHNGGLLLRGTLSGTKTVPVVNGVATFSDLSIDQIGNGYTLVVSAPGATSAESAPFNIGLL